MVSRLRDLNFGCLIEIYLVLTNLVNVNLQVLLLKFLVYLLNVVHQDAFWSLTGTLAMRIKHVCILLLL